MHNLVKYTRLSVIFLFIIDINAVIKININVIKINE